MDTSTEKDVQLQRASADLLSELKTTLPRFLYASDRRVNPNLEAPKGIRRRVRRSTTQDIIKLLEPFQEWPQLLDSSLSPILALLVDAYLEYLTKFLVIEQRWEGKLSAFTMPTRQAICKLLYILCKVRGPKIISRFLNNEAKYLQPLLDAFESWSPTPVSRNSPHNAREWSWQERYIVLLWLSHLMLTPFDLVTIASPIDMNGEDISEGMRLPAGLPSVAVHIIRICAENMIAPGKERESAVTLLTRLTLRPDMQRIGLLGAMMQWACSYLSSRDSSPRSIYKSVGILSFLAGIISSADAIIIQPFLLSTFQCVENINVKATQLSSEIMVSALARKIIIKILRVVTVAALQFDSTHARSPIPSVLDIILEDTINQLLVALADGDTPVRCAASKALSVITLKLQPMMAAEVLHAVLESLNENVLWEEHVVIQPLNLNNTHVSSSFKSKERNLTTVNSLQWQGLVLTLAHLLFRRSPPPEELPMILNALILALSFEQRSANGTSIGTTVRDAACFGIWSLARRYTTKELLSVETSAFFTIEEHESISILQILANELVVTATLDVSGNIRRGASAALQELVGRHPDTILHGIALVQIVDYHAIAFRHRAITEIAFEAAKIHVLYWSAIMNGLLGWRGIGGSESETRKLASVVLGKLAIAQESRGIEATTIQIRGQLARHGSKDIEKRHGALLTLAAILEEVILLGDEGHVDSTDLNLFQLWALFDSTTLLNDKDFTSSTLRPELTIEAACSLIRALSLTVTRSPHRAPKPPSTSLIRCVHIISISLEHSDEKIIHSVSAAVKTLFTILDNDMKDCLFTTWITKVQADQSTGIRGSRNVNNYISVLGALFEWYAGHPSYQEDIIDALVTQAKSHLDIETRIAALRSLRVGVLCCCVMTEPISTAIADSLDDYTIDQRGDIGSLVRIEAIDAVHASWEQGQLPGLALQDLGSKVCRLALEKLDRVRVKAWHCLHDIWDDLSGGQKLSTGFIGASETSSSDYYLHALSLFPVEPIRQSLLRGYISSAGTGSESILQASRAALSTHLEVLSNDQLADFLKVLLAILKESLAIERLVVSALEVLGFLFETRAVYRVPTDQFNWRNLCTLVQKAHYKSTNISKLIAAVGVYMGLASIKATQQEAQFKLASMLLHPYPQVRNAASEALFICSEEPILQRVDWYRSPKELKGDVVKIQESLRKCEK